MIDLDLNMDLRKIIDENIALMVYFYNTGCVACEALRPRVRELAGKEFPELRFIEINAADKPGIAAEASVYSAPTIVVYFEGRETIRESKYISVPQLGEKVSRYYDMLFPAGNE